MAALLHSGSVFLGAGGKCERVFGSPPPLKSPGQCSVTKPHSFSPCLEGFGFSSESYKEGVPAVSLLLLFSGPSAVVRLIAFIVVNALYGVLIAWGMFHVSKKRYEFQPVVTNFDSPASVVWVMMIVWIKAALQHVTPNSVYSRFGKPVSGPFRALRATIFSPRVKFTGGGKNDGFTSAPTLPFKGSIDSACHTNNSKQSKLAFYEIDWSWHTGRIAWL